MSFIEEFKTAFKKADGTERKNAKKWMLTHPTLTVSILFLIVAVIGGSILWSFQPPQPPPQTYTLVGAWGVLMTIQLPWIVWVGIFLFLWITKW